MNFAVLECFQTYDLYVWGAVDYRVWIPLKEGKAAFSGYAFVPAPYWPEMRRHCPSRFGARVLKYDLLNRPFTVTDIELVAMQKAIDWVDVVWEPAVGDLVRVVLGPFAGFTGVVHKVKGGNARILLGTVYVTLPVAFLGP
jgi:transcription antitermination factor NusG